VPVKKGIHEKKKKRGVKPPMKANTGLKALKGECMGKKEKTAKQQTTVDPRENPTKST